MLSVTDGILLDDLSLMMAFELLIVIALIVLFIVSLCSLLQKIRRAYDQEGSTHSVRLTEVYVREVPPNYGEHQGEVSHGIYPGGISPPAYTEYYDPPPKYDDVIKTSPPVVLPEVHQNTAQSQPISVVSQIHRDVQ